MKLRKKLAGIAVTCVCFVWGSTSLLSVSAAGVNAARELPEAPAIEAEAAVVMDVDSGTVLYEKNPHEQLYPASITKVLTGLLIAENAKLGEKMTFSYDAVHKTEGSGIWRDVDEEMYVEQSFYAMMLNSANECAYALAEKVGGSYDHFVQMMNDRAVKLGATDTHFTNPNGLPDENHVTSAYDMALISAEAIQNEEFRTVVGTRSYVIPPTNKHPEDNTYLQQHHKMIFPDSSQYYEYCIGGKTGYTEAAGNTLITWAEKDGVSLVCVILKDSNPGHYQDTRALLDYCYDNISAWDLSKQAQAENLVTGAEPTSSGAQAVELTSADQAMVNADAPRPFAGHALLIWGIALGVTVVVAGCGIYLWKTGRLNQIKWLKKDGDNDDLV